MSIRILPPEVASQIAAGEVVERPASVVKELIENALDAGATQISIKVEGAGRRLVEVADNGCGIPAEELPLAVERHATSKLVSAADLWRIQTLGFRGEALASIASVSLLTLTSRTAKATLGARLRVEGGKIHPPEPVGSPPGTVVRVENLFYNVPARLKFLKREATERRWIDHLVVRYALAYPQVRFHLIQDKYPSLQTSGLGERREVLGALYGAEAARQMLTVFWEEDNLRISGFISPLFLTRSHRRDMFFYVNGRPVQDTALSAALLKGYHTFLMVGRFPLAALFIELPPEAVDVNVHPTKAEVRFRQPDRLFAAVQSAVRRALLANQPVALSTSLPASDAPSGKDVPPPLPWPGWPPMPTPQTPEPSPSISVPNESQPLTAPTQSALPGERLPLLRPVGQVAATYLVAEGPDGLYLIDQHAAHERILFERFLEQHQKGVVSQNLLQPLVVHVSAPAARLLNEYLPLLNEWGFQVEPFGSTYFVVRSIPAILGNSDPGQALQALIEDSEEDEAPLQALQEQRLIARICKRVAIKGGTRLSPEEQRALLADLEACQMPRTCPHGRPTMIHLSVDLLERQFGRRGAR